MPALPPGIHLKQFAQFRDCGIIIVFIAERASQVAADRSFLGRQTFGFTVFLDCFVKLSLIVQHDSQIVMRLPGQWVEAQRMPVRHRRGSEISHIPQGDPHIVISPGIVRLTLQRFLECVESGVVAAISIET